MWNTFVTDYTQKVTHIRLDLAPANPTFFRQLLERRFSADLPLYDP